MKSYTSLHTLVNDMFPPTSLVEQVNECKILKIWPSSLRVRTDFVMLATNSAVIILYPCRKTITLGIFGKYRCLTLNREDWFILTKKIKAAFSSTRDRSIWNSSHFLCFLPQVILTERATGAVFEAVAIWVDQASSCGIKVKMFVEFVLSSSASFLVLLHSDALNSLIYRIINLNFCSSWWCFEVL